MPSKLLWLCIILFIVGSGGCADIPSVFSGGSSDIADYSSDQLAKASAASHDIDGVPAIYFPSDSEVLEFPVAGSGSESTGTAKKVVGELKDFYEKTPLRLPEWYIPKPFPAVEKYGLIAVLGNISNPKYSVAFSPYGSILASGSRDGTIRLWQMA